MQGYRGARGKRQVRRYYEANHANITKPVNSKGAGWAKGPCKKQKQRLKSLRKQKPSLSYADAWVLCLFQDDQEAWWSYLGLKFICLQSAKLVLHYIALVQIRQFVSFASRRASLLTHRSLFGSARAVVRVCGAWRASCPSMLAGDFASQRHLSRLPHSPSKRFREQPKHASQVIRFTHIQIPIRTEKTT